MPDIAMRLMPARALESTKSPRRYYLGLVNVRGAVITVLDLHEFFGSGAVQQENLQELIIVEFGKLTLGVAVKTVLDVQRILRSKIKTLDDMVYTRGAFISSSGRVIILDGDEIALDRRFTGTEFIEEDES
jgi:chemotaxis signal transduction protein